MAESSSYVGEQENRAAASRFVQDHNQPGYLETLDAMLATDCVIHEYLPGVSEPMDRQAFSHFIAMFRDAMPDINDIVEDVITEGEHVAVRWSLHGTHTGTVLIGIPPSNEPIVAHGIYIFRFAQGKIEEIWNNWDNLIAMRQLGHPTPQPK